MTAVHANASSHGTAEPRRRRDHVSRRTRTSSGRRRSPTPPATTAPPTASPTRAAATARSRQGHRRITPRRSPRSRSRRRRTSPLSIVLAGTDPDGDAVAFRIIDDARSRHARRQRAEPDLHARARLPRRRLLPLRRERQARRVAAGHGRDHGHRGQRPPAAQPDSITSGVGRAAAVASATLVGNDTAGPFDEHAQTLTVSAVSATPDTHGTVSLADGSGHIRARGGFPGHGEESPTRSATTARRTARPTRVRRGPALDRGQPGSDRHRSVGIHAAQHGRDDHPRRHRSRGRRAHVRRRARLRRTERSPVPAKRACIRRDTGFAGADSFTFTVADAYSTSHAGDRVDRRRRDAAAGHQARRRRDHDEHVGAHRRARERHRRRRDARSGDAGRRRGADQRDGRCRGREDPLHAGPGRHARRSLHVPRLRHVRRLRSRPR